jgi:hypothetical protein
MATVAIPLDDVHARTPLALDRALPNRRPVTPVRRAQRQIARPDGRRVVRIAIEADNVTVTVTRPWRNFSAIGEATDTAVHACVRELIDATAPRAELTTISALARPPAECRDVRPILTIGGR